MQPNVRTSPGGDEDKLLAFGLILAVFAGGGWYLWFKYRTQISAAVMAAQHWQMLQFGALTDSYADLDRQVLATDPEGVSFAALFRLCRNVGSFLRLPAVALTGALALLCLTRAAPEQYTRNLDLDGLLRTQAKMFRSLKPFIGRGLDLVPAADGKPRPADPALHVREWVARHATTPDGQFSHDAGRAALARQLGPAWTGVAQAAPHVRCLFAAFVLHAGRQREEAIALLGDMAESLPLDPDDGPAGPATPLHFGARAVERSNEVLLDAELVAPCAAVAARHCYTAPALMSVLLHARAQVGVLAPGQFAFLKLVNRLLWYALHSLGFSSEMGTAGPMPNPRVEALGARDHWAAECALRRPLRTPALGAAMDTIRIRMKQAAPPPNRPQEAP